jgi:PleD family two-component response regulator
VDAKTPKSLLTRADARLFAAKRAGRGRCIGMDVPAA